METKTQSKHTPGPWKIKSYDDGRGRYQDGSYRKRVVYEIRGNCPSHAVAEVAELKNDNEGYSAESDCNARLIASAPELLAALKNFMGCRAQGHKCTPNDSDFTAGQAAIAKAEGR